MQAVPTLIGIYGGVTLLSLVRQAKWPAELLTHFRPQMIVFGLAGALLCLLSIPGWEWAAISFGLALIHYAALPVQPCVAPEEHLSATAGVTIVWANVWKSSGALKRTLAWAVAQNADVIVIGEFPPAGPDPAAVPQQDYPHRLDTGPRERKRLGVQMAVFSRLPIINGLMHEGPGPRQRPFLSFSLSVGDATLNIVGAHPVPPFTPGLLQERDAHIAKLPALTKAPFVLVGDFNATPWSPGYTAIPGRRVGAYMLAPTWLTGLPLLGLPIDHIMISDDMKASAYRVAPFTGSDHRAIIARVHLPSGAKT